jgi:hypothetical protein
MNAQPAPLAPESPWVFRLQLALLIGFTLFAASIIGWIARLIYVSWIWHDVFSASIGIALVAVPVFLFLLFTFNYVFWGVLRGGHEESHRPSPVERP